MTSYLLNGVLVSGRDGVGADAAVRRREVDGEPGRGDHALVVVRALAHIALDERRSGRGVGHGSGVGRVTAVGRGLSAGAGAQLRAVRSRLRCRAGAAKVLAVRVRVGKRAAARGRGDVPTARLACPARQHRRRGVLLLLLLLLLVLVRVGRRRAAVCVLSGHGGEYVRAVDGLQPGVLRADQLDRGRRWVHLGDQRRRGRRRAVDGPAAVLRRVVSALHVLFFHAHVAGAVSVVVIVVVGLLTVVIVDHVHHQLLLVLLLATVTARRYQHHFRPSDTNGLQPVRIATLVRWPAAAVMAQVLGFALQRLLMQEQSLQVTQVPGADLQSSGAGSDQSVGRFQL